MELKLNKMDMKMMTKNLMVFFLAIASVLLLVGTVSALDELANITKIEVDDIGTAAGNDEVSVIAGDTTSVEVYFTALEDASDVRMEVEIDGEKVDVSKKIGPMDLEEGKKYRKVLNLKLPYELKDEVSDDLTLEIKIWNSDYKTELDEDVTLRVQRPSYNAAVMSIESKDSVSAGETILIDAVIKNVGYNYLDDLYVTVEIPETGLKRTTYVGDVVAVECCDDEDECCDEDEEDTVSARFTLEVPYDINPGVYSLQVEARNSDLQVSAAKNLVVENDFASGNLIASTLKRNFDVGETAEYEMVVVNPTDKLKVYRVVVESPEALDLSLRNSVVAVPAGSSKTVKMEASSEESGEYQFTANLFSGEKLMSTVDLNAGVNKNGDSDTSIDNPIVILTIVLAVVFLVLLVVLIVLLGRKPERTEDFGESYY